MAEDSNTTVKAPVLEESVSTGKETDVALETAAVPLTRKRTREDFEADHGEETEKEERKIVTIKRRKSDCEDPKKPVLEKAKEVGVIPEGSKEGTVEAEEKPAEETNIKDQTEQDSQEVTTKDSKPESTEKDDIKKEDFTETQHAETDAIEEKKETGPAKEAPKFVFGASSTFGSNTAFSMMKKKNVFASLPESTPEPAAPASTVATGSIFGSNSTFGNVFQNTSSKKSIFEEEKKGNDEKKEGEEEKEEEKEESDSSKNAHLYKQVNLEKKEIKSGEEDEEHVFTCRAKLYALDITNVKDGWKERGAGNVHVNKSKEIGKSSRIIMRSNGLLKVILNTPLVHGLDVVKGMPSSLSSEKFIRITSLEDKKPIQYAIKTGNVETTETLFNTVTDLIPKEV